MHLSFFKNSFIISLISFIRDSFSSFPTVLTMPGRSIKVRSTQSGPNNSISTMSGATCLSEILKIKF